MGSRQIELMFDCRTQKLSQVTIDRDSFDLNILHNIIYNVVGLGPLDYYVTGNGKIINDGSDLSAVEKLRICPKIFGGKGGFGSMLRAIGAQIEKTTNRDACRDLSGRRLRDINEEQRLKRWFSKQSEREQEKEELRQKKLEKLRRLQDGPELPQMNDPEYFKQREEIEDAVYAAVDAGFDVAKPTSSTAPAAAGAETVSVKDSEASNSSSSAEDVPKPSSTSLEAGSSKRPHPEKKAIHPKKKLKKLMLDEDFSSDSSEESDEEVGAVKN